MYQSLKEVVSILTETNSAKLSLLYCIRTLDGWLSVQY